MTSSRPVFRRGVTLVEVMLAGGILALLSVALLNGIGQSAQLTHDDSEYLFAHCYAFDVALKRSREKFSSLLSIRNSTNGAEFRETISSNACPTLYREGSGNAAESITRITWAKDATGAADQNALMISVDVEWGPRGKRKKLSNSDSAVVVVKTKISEEK